MTPEQLREWADDGSLLASQQSDVLRAFADALDKLESLDRLARTATVDSMTKVAANNPEKFKSLIAGYMKDSADLKKAHDALDLMRDEFIRIRSIAPSEEIAGICARAISSIERRVPMIAQLEEAERSIAALRLHLSDKNKTLEDVGAKLSAALEKLKVAEEALGSLLSAKRYDANKNRGVEGQFVTINFRAEVIAQADAALAAIRGK